MRIPAILVGSLLLVIPGARVVHADNQATQRIEGKQAEFTIDVPAGWEPIDPDVLQAMLDPEAMEDSEKTGKAVRYGYGPPVSDIQTNPPYLAIEVRRMRRIPERLMGLQAKPEFLRKTLSTVLARKGIPDRNILECSFDTNKHCVRLSCIQPAYFGEGELRLLRLTYYTEEGAISCFAVCPKEEWPRWESRIEGTLKSLQIPARLQYQPRTSERDLRDSNLTKAFFFVLFMILGAGMVWIMYDRAKNFVRSDEVL